MKKEIEFLKESNAIERVYSQEALEDAINGWSYAKEHRYEIGIPFIEQVHERLMIRLNPRIAGKIRTIPIYVGNKISSKECLKPELIHSELEKWVGTYSLVKKDYEIKEAHIVFEKIHPFEDGNGRTGRILMNIQRLNAKLTLLVIHEGEEQLEYYKWFK